MSTPPPYRSPLDNARAELSTFLANNTGSSVEGELDKLFVVKPWSDESLRFALPATGTELTSVLNALVLPPKFVALYHIDKQELEFIYRYAKSADLEVNRAFELTVEGHTYRCRFDTPSDRLLALARQYERRPGSDSDSSLRNLPVFRDGQRLNALPEPIQKWFKDRVPLSFFVEPVSRTALESFPRIAESFNFALEYYDRASPLIIVVEPADPFKIPYARYLESSFPKQIALPNLDPILLNLLKAAKAAKPRFGMVYYFQVLEHAGFYFLDEKVRKRVRQFLRDPAVVNCADDKVEGLIDVLTESQASDDARIKKVVEERVDPDALWPDVENSIDFLSSEVQFDGGFVLPPIVSKNINREGWRVAWHPKLIESFTKVRNVIVHARERRQAVSILPTWRNEGLLGNLVPLVRRLAEQVTLGSG